MEGLAGQLQDYLDPWHQRVCRSLPGGSARVSTGTTTKRFADKYGVTAWMPAQVVDERLAGSSVEYLQLNELSEALQRNLQSMHHAKCLFMMRAWHQARSCTALPFQQGHRPGSA